MKSLAQSAVVLFLAGIASVSAQTPAFRAEGPLPVSAASYPFGAADHTRTPSDLQQVGYVEEEFLFSGTVIVEMLNPSNLFDLNIGWAVSHAQFVRNGDAWVGITAKPVAVARDSDRATENGLVWDIHRQVGQWLRGRGPNSPFTYGTSSGAHPVERLYAWGYSQTGGYLYTYVNAIHPLDVKQLGKPLFDAYLIAVASGPSPINQCFAPMPAGDPRRVVKDVGAPVVPMACNEGPRSRFPSSVAFNAILRNLDLWVRKGTPPPKAEQIKVVGGNSTGESFCRFAGHEKPFDAARLAELYPKPGDYAKAVATNVKALVAARFITEADGQSLMAEARLVK